MTDAGDETRNLSAITTLKSRLGEIIEPDFGLLDHLLSLHVLTLRQFADVRSERTVYRRNDALLDLMTSEEQCDKLLKALKRTGQQHVANYITQNGGQKHSDVANYQSNVTYDTSRHIYLEAVFEAVHTWQSHDRGKIKISRPMRED